MEDAKIIDLYFARAEGAIRETDNKYGAYLNQIAYRILQNTGDSEEIVNDTYLKAWQAIPPTRPSVLKHFLSRITRNLSLNRLDYKMAKCRNLQAQVAFSELEDCIPDEKQAVESVWEAKEIGRILNLFLGELSKQECAVFLSRYYYVLTLQEIALKYQMSQRQVKYMLSKLRSRLKRHLEKEGVVL